jgi:acyl-coenzyme A thioesterase PaaI-like protein
MLVSERVLKWVINFYPPLLFQRIRVVKFDKGFRGVEVKVIKSFLNKNFNNAIFGGTLFAAADPFYPLLFFNIFTHKGYKLRTWSHSLAIRYHKPSKTNMHFKISISDEEVEHCEEVLNTTGKFRRTFHVKIYDADEQLCVTVLSKIYMRNLNFMTDANELEV